MAKLTKDQKRKAKLKARKRHAENALKNKVERIAHALETLCDFIAEKYLDTTVKPDLEGYGIVYTIGLYAWNICVSGHSVGIREALEGGTFDPEQLAVIEDDIGFLIKKKYELFPEITTGIFKVKAVAVNGVPHAKITLGKTFPQLPEVKWEPGTKELSAEDIADIRKKMKLTQIKFGELFGVSAKKVSEWEHGKSRPKEEQMAALNTYRNKK